MQIAIKNNNEEIEIDDSKYDLDESNGILMLHLTLAHQETLMVRYLAGFADNTIPFSIKHGIFMHIADMYDREESATQGLSEAIKNCYLPYRELKI